MLSPHQLKRDEGFGRGRFLTNANQRTVESFPEIGKLDQEPELEGNS